MHLRHVILAGILVVSLLTTAPTAAAAPTSSFTVDIHENGSADVAVTYTFDLETDSEQAAFQELRDNQSARAATAMRFEERLAAVAANTADRTGRQMSVGNATTDVSTDGSTGVVTLAVTWQGLAAVDGDSLVMTEPFASEFDPDRRFVITLPEGYTAAVTPAADIQEDGRLTWDSGTSLDGFELTASAESASNEESASNGDTTGTSSGSGPGLGLVAGVIGLVTVGLLGRRIQ